MDPIDMPPIAGEAPSDREHLDHNGYCNPHLIIRYGIVGWLLSRFNGLGIIGHTDVPQMHALARNVREQESHREPSRLPQLQEIENRIRNQILQDFTEFLSKPTTSNDFDADRTRFLFQTCTSALLYSVANSLPEQFPNPGNLMVLNSFDYVKGFLKTYNDFGSDSYDLYEFTNALAKTIREYFRRFVLGLKDGSIRLDPRYRQHFRNSLLAAFDRIRDDLGDAYWNKEFPRRDPNSPFPETRSYDLNDESTVYDWDVDNLPADGRIILRQPYAPILEAHHRAKLKVFLDALTALHLYTSCQGIKQRHAIALLICFDEKASQLLQEMGVPYNVIMQLSVSAHADNAAICLLACQSERADI